jgi:hypothetical protein
MRKNPGVLTAVVALLIAMPSLARAADWLGVWKVVSTKGMPYYITLSKDGEAESTMEPGYRATWEEKDGKAWITFASGWKAILYDDNGAIMKAAFKRDKEFTDQPDSITPAERVPAIPRASD